jgi:hypothetical protein
MSEGPEIPPGMDPPSSGATVAQGVLLVALLVLLVLGIPIGVGVIVFGHDDGHLKTDGPRSYPAMLGLAQVRAALENYLNESKEVEQFLVRSPDATTDAAVIQRESNNAAYAWKHLYDVWISERGRPQDCPGYVEHAADFDLPR